MHQKFTQHQKKNIYANNQLPTNTLIGLKNNFIIHLILIIQVIVPISACYYSKSHNAIIFSWEYINLPRKIIIYVL